MSMCRFNFDLYAQCTMTHMSLMTVTQYSVKAHYMEFFILGGLTTIWPTKWRPLTIMGSGKRSLLPQISIYYLLEITLLRAAESIFSRYKIGNYSLFISGQPRNSYISFGTAFGMWTHLCADEFKWNYSFVREIMSFMGQWTANNWVFKRWKRR